MVESNPPLTIIRLRQLQKRIGLARSSIYDRLDPDSPRCDPTFPKPIRLGAKSRAIGFIESEVEEWLARQVEQRRQATESSKAEQTQQTRAGGPQP